MALGPQGPLGAEERGPQGLITVSLSFLLVHLLSTVLSNLLYLGKPCGAEQWPLTLGVRRECRSWKPVPAAVSSRLPLGEAHT